MMSAYFICNVATMATIGLLLLLLLFTDVSLSSSLSNKNNNSDALGENNNNVVQQLITNLFTTYNKEAVLEMPTVIHMDILLLKVKNTIEKEGIFESVIALMIEWHDRRMTWTPAEYGNLTFLSLSTDQVWLPDIAMTNSAEHLYSISRDSRFTVRVSHDGMFKFVPTGTARTWCDLKLLTFPFDIQHCSLEFESWSLDSTTMTFDGNSELLVDSSFASTQFQLCEHRAITYYHTYNFTGETFTRLRFEFTVRRKSTFYVINLIFPCATLSFIQLLTFLIPSTDTTVDRIGFGTTNLLTLVVFQTIVTEEMPKTSDAVTALSKYVICLIIMAAVGILESVIVDRLLEKSLHSPPPWLLFSMKYVPILLRETPAEKRNHIYKQRSYYQHSLHFTPSENIPPYHYYENDEALLKENIENKQNEAHAVNHPVLLTPPANSGGGSGGGGGENSQHPEEVVRRPSYQLAMSTDNKMTLACLLKNKLKQGGVNPSMSMLSFQPSLLSVPDIRIENTAATTTTTPNNCNKNQVPNHQQYYCSNCALHQQRFAGCCPYFVEKNQQGQFFQRQGVNNKNSNVTAAQPKQRRCYNNNDDEFCLNNNGSSSMSGIVGTTTANNYVCASDLWAEIAYKIDCLALFLCAVVAVLAPMTMFLPLVVLDDNDVCGIPESPG